LHFKLIITNNALQTSLFTQHPMKKLLFVILTLFPLMAFSQTQPAGGSNYQVKGQAIDSLTNETIPFVTCSVVQTKNPQQVITRFAGDADGNFSGELKAPGNYTLMLTFVGKAVTKRQFTVSATQKVAQLGKIAMPDSHESLKEVTVTATRPLVKVEADKVSYDVQQDPESKTSTALDLLRKVPMVTVDGQDNIQLKGSSNFKIFLNGKPSNLFSNNPSQVLKNFPASSIKNIEVITQPGAKYDAEGVGGIINIVTDQQTKTKGYSLGISAQASSRGTYGGGINLSLQAGKFSFSGSYYASRYVNFPLTTTSTRDTYLPTPYPHVSQEASVQYKVPAQFGNGSLSYELDTMNLFTLSFNRQYGKQNGVNKASTKNYDNGMKPLFYYDQNSIQSQTWGSTDIGFDYQHTFKKKDETLTFSYKWSNTPNNSNLDAVNTIDPVYSTDLTRTLVQRTISANNAASNEHTWQVDFSDPLAKNHTLEMGVKYILRLNSSNSDENYMLFNFNQPYPFKPYTDSAACTNFDNNQKIAGVYISYTGTLGKFGLKPGVRYEYTWQHVVNQDTLFDSNYGVLVPSVIVTYKLTDMQTFKLAYNMRIQRPSIWYLNPYVNRSDPNYISYGNPALDPEKSNSITVGYSNYAPKFNVSAELSYTFVNNAIQQYSFMRQGSPIQEITYGNIGHNRNLYLNVFGNYRGLKWLNIYLNGNVGYVNMSSGSYNMSNNGFTGNMYMGATFMLPKDWRINLGGGGNLPQVNLQGSQSSFFFSYSSLSKDFMKKKLTLSANMVYLPKSHIIITTKGVDSKSNMMTFNQRTDVHITQPVEFRFSVSYRIGNLSAQVKKTKTTISNDDQKAGQSGNTGTGQSPM